MLTYHDCIDYVDITDSEMSKAARAVCLPPMVTCGMLASARNGWPIDDSASHGITPLPVSGTYPR